MAREQTRPVCEGLTVAMGSYGVPQQILTDIQAWWCLEGPWIVRPAV